MTKDERKIILFEVWEELPNGEIVWFADATSRQHARQIARKAEGKTKRIFTTFKITHKEVY